MERGFLKEKLKNQVRTSNHLYFRAQNNHAGKNFVRCSFGSFDNLQKKNIFKTLFFNKMMLLCLYQKFLQRKGAVATGMALKTPDLIPIENFWEIWRRQLRKQTVLWKNLSRKLLNFGPRYRYNLCQNCTDRLVVI